MEHKYKVGDRVKLTPERFAAFRGLQGVVDPNRIYTVERLNSPTSIILKEIVDQRHGLEHILLYKPKICILIKT